MHRVLAVLVLTVGWLSLANADYDEYASLISDVRTEYLSSSAFIVINDENSRMEESTKAHSLTRALANLGTLTLVTNFEHLREKLYFYAEPISRPLVVILLKSMGDILKFRKSTKRLPETMRIWMVIFRGHLGDQFCEYCRNPSGNVLGLSFHTPMIVVCCDDPELQEWWSVVRNRTEIGHFGTWTANERLKLVTKDELKSRHRNFKGAKLRMVVHRTVNYHAKFVDRMNRFFEEITSELGRALNFTTVPEYYHKAKISYILDKSIDVRGFLIPAPEKFSKENPTYPLDSWPTKLYIKVPDGMGVQWFGYFKVFGLKIWVTVIVLIITIPVLLTIMKLQYGEKLSFSLYTENFLCVWGIFHQQSVSKFPTQGPMRLAYFSIFVSGIIVYAAYSAKLISFLTVKSFPLPFSDLTGFIEDGSYQVVVRRNGTHHTYMENLVDGKGFPEMRRLLKPEEKLPATIEEAWKQVCEERVAFFTGGTDTDMETIGCKVVGINTERLVTVLMFSPRYEFADAMKYHMGRFKENGMLRRSKAIGFDESPKTVYYSVDHSHVALIFVIMAGGIVLAIVVFICEFAYSACENRRRRLKIAAKSQKKKMRRFLRSRRRKKETSNERSNVK